MYNYFTNQPQMGYTQRTPRIPLVSLLVVIPFRRGSRKKLKGGFICRPPTVKLAQHNKDFMTFFRGGGGGGRGVSGIPMSLISFF